MFVHKFINISEGANIQPVFFIDSARTHDHDLEGPGYKVLLSSDADPVLGSGSGSADPVFKIRIRLTQQKTGSGSGSYLVMFLMFSKIKKIYGIFLTNLSIFMTL